MKKEKKDKHFIKKPIYEGGRAVLKSFIKTHLKYPKKALQEKIEGTVSLKYTIDHTGKVIDTKVISSLGHGCDEEAIRLVKLLKFQVPKIRGRRVLFHKDIQIHFRLPKSKKASTPSSFQYNYTSSTSKTEPSAPESKNSKTSYHYTITIPNKKN